jgi:hypothetical protein
MRPSPSAHSSARARRLGVAILHHVEDRVEAGQHGQNRIAVEAKSCPWSMAVLAARTRSKMGARASAVFRSLASAAQNSRLRLLRGLLQRGILAGGKNSRRQPR